MKIAFILAAAGTGSRMKAGINKTLLKIGGRSILEIALNQICSLDCVVEIAVTTNKNDKNDYADIIKNTCPNLAYCVDGGKTRSMSVLNALTSLKKDYDYIAIHDAARPFLSKSLFSNICKALEKHEIVVPCLRAKDTMYRLNSSESPSLIDRANVIMVQTPQCFSKRTADIIRKKLEFVGQSTNDYNLTTYTDEISVALEAGEAVFFADGSVYLSKITEAEDSAIAEVNYRIFKDLEENYV